MERNFLNILLALEGFHGMRPRPLRILFSYLSACSNFIVILFVITGDHHSSALRLASDNSKTSNYTCPTCNLNVKESFIISVDYVRLFGYHVSTFKKQFLSSMSSCFIVYN